MNNQSNPQTCSFFCFPNSPKNTFTQSSQQNHVKISKLSLKKVLEQETKQQIIKRSISDQNLTTKYGSQTSRSYKQVQQKILFKKKNKIESQMKKVDEEINLLTSKYQRSICQLRVIKKKLENLKQQ